MTPRGVLAFCREKEVKAIDLRYTDLFGTWQHITVPLSRLSEASFEQGFAIDTSNYPVAWSGDRLIIPQASSAFLDPFASIPTLILIGSLQDPITREDDLLDARIIAGRSVDFLHGTGIADRARLAATCEFYLFKNFQAFVSPGQSSVRFPTDAARPGSEHPNLAQSGAMESGQLHPTFSPTDSSIDFRNEVMELLFDANIPVAQHFQRNGCGGQSALEIEGNNLVSTADSLMAAKFMVRSAARQHARFATFMPKPIEHLRGSGMPLHFSLWRGDEPLFGGQGYGGLSEIAMLSIGGILHHAPALTAICNPTTNSYRRLHHSAFHSFQLGYSLPPLTSVCRIPTISSDPRLKCIEFCTPDASANPYLAFAAILMAAIDGIQNKIEPGSPMSSDTQPATTARPMPRSLWDALDSLEQDCEFLMRGEVFSREMLDGWLHYKRNVERPAVESAPTPAEFLQYFDC